MIKRDEKGRFAEKRANYDHTQKKDMVSSYGYYSKVLNKPFDSLEELQAAEHDHEVEEKAKLVKVGEKKELAHKIESKYSDYIKTLEDGNKQISEFVSKIKAEQTKAYNEYMGARNEFIDKYGSFHMTFVDKKPVVDTAENSLVEARKAYEDTLANLFDAFRSFPFNF